MISGATFYKRLFKQKQVRILGAVNQVMGGAVGWFGTFTFIFSAITAWNTPTLGEVRAVFPWLTIYSFVVIILSIMLLAMFLQHKYVQPSSVDYWRKMFYDNNPSEQRMVRIEQRQKIMCQILVNLVPTEKKDEAKELIAKIKES